jgi:16S rRNA (guanine527-N7)-methyltransferase
MSADRDAFVERENVSRETLVRLDAYIDTLDAWRMRSNLIGPNEWPQIWTRHVADSWQLLRFIDPKASVVDLGSGAGFPGLVIAAARPEARITLIESVGKKCAFLRAAIEAGAFDVTVLAERVEAVAVTNADIVTARAFAPLPKLLEYAAPWLENGAMGLFPKGERWKEELTAAQESWRFAYEAVENRSGGSGVILIVKELRHGGQA